MFEEISRLLKKKFQKKDELAKHVEIIKIFEIYKTTTKKIIGSTIKVEPVSFQKRTLTIKTKSSVQANELRMYEQRILERINKEMGQEMVARIIYRF